MPHPHRQGFEIDEIRAILDAVDYLTKQLKQFFFSVCQ